MQVKDIYENALAMDIARMDDDEEMEFFAIKLFNVLLYEAKAYNDQIRLKKGLMALEAVPKICSVEDEMPFEPEMYAPLSYGLAAKLLTAQQEINQATIYNSQYLELLESATPYVAMEVRDEW